jgi:hypothetical protein
MRRLIVLGLPVAAMAALLTLRQTRIRRSEIQLGLREPRGSA